MDEKFKNIAIHKEDFERVLNEKKEKGTPIWFTIKEALDALEQKKRRSK